MSLLYPAQEKELKGPWLIGAKELLELDSVIDQIKYHLRESSVKESDRFSESNDATKIISHTMDPVVEIRIRTKDGKSLVDSSIQEILKDPTLENIKPIGIEINVDANETNLFVLEIAEFEDSDGYYEIECYDQKEMVNISHLINRWIENNQPNKIKQSWKKVSEAIVGISLLAILFLSLGLYEENLPSTENYYKKDVKKLIETGINDSNRDAAMNLVLKLAIDYLPDGVKPITVFNDYLIKYLVYSIIALLIGIIRPKTIIGLGKNEIWLKFYTWYIKGVLYFLIPAVIIEPIIMNIINYLKIMH